MKCVFVVSVCQYLRRDTPTQSSCFYQKAALLCLHSALLGMPSTYATDSDRTHLNVCLCHIWINVNGIQRNTRRVHQVQHSGYVWINRIRQMGPRCLTWGWMWMWLRLNCYIIITYKNAKKGDNDDNKLWRSEPNRGINYDDYYYYYFIYCGSMYVLCYSSSVI